MLSHPVPSIVEVEPPLEKQLYLNCVCADSPEKKRKAEAWGRRCAERLLVIQRCFAQSCLWDQFICFTKAFHCVSEKASMVLNPLATYLRHFYAHLCCVPPRSISPTFSLLLDW